MLVWFNISIFLSLYPAMALSLLFLLSQQFTLSLIVSIFVFFFISSPFIVFSLLYLINLFAGDNRCHTPWFLFQFLSSFLLFLFFVNYLFPHPPYFFLLSLFLFMNSFLHSYMLT
ncbi:hypothetical protein L873DRAFT_602345 [Choiromyces venosus 120613-1]|uniref:Uncharacterized protein n=1 Tax=Choiromyces venosus 120613-1 TaxID=1336337 RepID=A0A3N4JXP6_9PEZI|nr:hypothetical protein L873DRAFT_602345 [Choiromyces venosus 120613-1]